MDAVLWSTLRAPAPAEYLDAVYVEAGSEMSGFDRIIYAHLREGEEPLAMYVGEIEVRPAADRRPQGQKVVVETRDDFQNAQQELRRLYPRFDGPVLRMAPSRSAALPR